MRTAGRRPGPSGRQRWWRRQDVRYWYVLGIAFLLAGAGQIGLAVARHTGTGYVMIGLVYLLISAAWLAVGGSRHRREPPDVTGD